MPFPTITPTALDTLTSTTLQNYLPQMEINVITSVPIVKYLLDEGARRTQGGTRINVQLLYGYNQTTTWYNMSDYLDVSPQEAVTAAQFKWANLMGAITLFGEEQAQNAGDAIIQDFVMAKITQLELSIARQLNQAAYGDGTGFFGGAPDGLSNIIYATATPANPPSGAVGGVDAVGFSFWRNNYIASGGTFLVNGAMGSGTPDYMLRMFNLCSDGALRPTLIVSDNATYEGYQQNAKTEYRTLETKNLDLGFEYVNYKGVPYVWDRDLLPQTGFNGTQFFLNNRFLYAVVDNNRFFQPTEWMPTINQDGKVMRLHVRMNYVCSNRMLQGLVNWA